MANKDIKKEIQRIANSAILSSVLMENRHKPFVKRILNPDKTLDLGKGKIATHQMAWGEVDNKFVAFPTVVGSEDGLTKLPTNKAFERAIETGDLISFPSKEGAEWFTKNYKNYWKERNITPGKK